MDLRKQTRAFERRTGRRPRILLAHMSRDDRPVKKLALTYASAGFDVDLCPGLKTPELLAKMAVENDVHVLGVLPGEHGPVTLAKSLAEELAAYGAEDIQVKILPALSAGKAGGDAGRRLARTVQETLCVIRSKPPPPSGGRCPRRTPLPFPDTKTPV